MQCAVWRAGHQLCIYHSINCPAAGRQTNTAVWCTVHSAVVVMVGAGSAVGQGAGRLADWQHWRPPHPGNGIVCIVYSSQWSSTQATAGCCWPGRRTSADGAPGRGSSAATSQRSSTASSMPPGTALSPTAMTVVTSLGRVLPSSNCPLPTLRNARAAVRELGVECKKFRQRPVLYFTGEGRPGTGDWGFRYMGQVDLVGFRVEKSEICFSKKYNKASNGQIVAHF